MSGSPAAIVGSRNAVRGSALPLPRLKKPILSRPRAAAARAARRARRARRADAEARAPAAG